MSYTVGSLFSGIGGIDLAAHWAGFETAWFVEKEPYPQTNLHKNWPNVPVYGDIFECHDLPYVDVIVGGFPCQPFSVAGKRQGANDERFLLPEMLRIISEVKPYAVLFENVAGFPSLNDGAEFKLLLRALAEMGFNAEWGHLRASDFGAPQQRERWFCVAYTNSFSSGTSWTDGVEAKSAVETTASREYVMVNTERRRSSIGAPYETRRTRSNREWYCSKNQRGRNHQQFRTTSSSETVGNSDSFRQQGQRAIRQQVVATRHRARQSQGAGNRGASNRPIKSRLGGNADGLSSRLDFPGWPSRPGEPQHEWEPPRVTSGRTPNRAARLKALGNAVVPQVVYPLMVAIREWLEEQSIEVAA